MELMDFCTIKPDENLTKEKSGAMLSRIDKVQNDLDFIYSWLKRHLKDTNDTDSEIASIVRGEAFQAWNRLQTVYRLLAAVRNNGGLK